MDQCIFCQIRDGEIPAKIVYEDPSVVAFHDINPKAEIHVLVIPRTHLESIADMKESDASRIGQMIYAAKVIGDQFHLSGYQLKFHVGPDGGQEVPHVHLHLLGSHPKQRPHKGGDHG